MKSHGAVLLKTQQNVRNDWHVEELEVSPPKRGEVMVKLRAAGLCHSDNHAAAGDQAVDFAPFLGGHEGAGIVEEIGEGVTELAVGDHVTCTFMPSCGTCVPCVRGIGQLCDRGAGLLQGVMLDGTNRIHTAAGEPVGPMTYLGTFSDRIVAPVDSVIKIARDIPFPAAALAGCAVPTGWGTAVRIAEVEIDDVVVVLGVGGVGMSAVQGAKHAGAREIVVIDPVAFKRREAPKFGATHVAASIEEAMPLLTDLTHGRMADKVIVTIGVVEGRMIQPMLGLLGKGGTMAIAGVSSMWDIDAQFNVFGFVMMQQTIKGGLYGGLQPRIDIPRLLARYQRGELMIDEMITRTYSLNQINEAYADMEAARNIRGVILHED
ncbi:alcohol dehydrogenase [Prauserella marina]|uniref:S-(Hydroxymethyl)glutathione dehydrogenase / alcohol dehydrogenase n=1 Tax=Prauserella marina TaxID=530584 RepID=A0A222VUT5_9PSEU|nr:NDMA-dependent alcohol dehydrogenase [Prauserella marina]ASR37660.1 alcohol dehydrogenase [Prauserella marina]PWV75582.1 S-(hydroxymethyl)glutathione dehydrogenase/alcohol dehydrogenase [Prauserella marina]SDD31342.1 S-(hydroxymethyl)glutathione dehydrogenase / alcohol dehydrogenase [Prauserella marina]